MLGKESTKPAARLKEPAQKWLGRESSPKYNDAGDRDIGDIIVRIVEPTLMNLMGLISENG